MLLPLAAPAMIVAYLFGAYKPKPGLVDGIYFPDGGFLFDLHVMWQAGHDVVTGHSPYPFVYPPPAAFLMAPFGALPWSVAVVAFTLAAIAALVLALRLLGVRDWRCHALALGALPMASSLMIGTLSPFLALGAAVAWRYRDRRWAVAAAIVGVVVTKIFLWPLFFWLLATRRYRTAATTVGLGIGTVFVSWGLLGFDGLRDYPHRLSRVAGLEQDKSYSPFALFRLLGLSPGSARLAVLGLTVAALGAIVAVARRQDGDRRSFLVALGAGLDRLTDPLDALSRPARCARCALPAAVWGCLVRSPCLLVSAGSGKPRVDPEHRSDACPDGNHARARNEATARTTAGPRAEFTVGLARSYLSAGGGASPLVLDGWDGRTRPTDRGPSR